MVSKRGNIQHIEINVSNFQKSKAFYQDFLEWLGYKRILDEKDFAGWRSEEHTSELQSRGHLVCRLLLEKKNNAVRLRNLTISRRSQSRKSLTCLLASQP